MQQLTAIKAFTYTVPVLDAKGDTIKTKVKFSKREVEVDVVDHVRVNAGATFAVDDAALAKSFLKDGLVRPYDEVLDDEDEIDPTKGGDPLG
jgi:hypothetical protein